MIAPILLAISILLLLVLSATSAKSLESFFNNIENTLNFGFQFGMPLCLMAIGVSLVIASGGIDISTAGVATLSGIIFAFLQKCGWPSYFAFIPAILFGFLSGKGLGIVVTRFNAPPMIFSWAMGSLWYGVSLLISIGFFYPFNGEGVEGISIPGTHFEDKYSFILLFIVIFLINLINYSGLPRRAKAIGANRDAATYAGVNVRNNTLWCYQFSGILAAISGILLFYYNGKASTNSYGGYELTAIAMAVLGGTVMSGGYLYLLSVLASAFFWTNALNIINNIMGGAGGSQAQQWINGIFSLFFILISIILGRKIGGITHTIQVERKTK